MKTPQIRNSLDPKSDGNKLGEVNINKPETTPSVKPNVFTGKLPGALKIPEGLNFVKSNSTAPGNSSTNDFKNVSK